MNLTSTKFLQAVILILGMGTLIMMIWLPLNEGRAESLDLLNIYLDPFVVYGYTTSLVFFIALYKAFKLLTYIGRNKAFSLESVRTLKSIKFWSIVFSILIALAGLYIRLFHNKDDDPTGFLAMCIIILFVSITIAVSASVLEKILNSGIFLQSKNEKLKK